MKSVTLSLILLLLAAHRASFAAESVQVVASTTLLQGIASAVGGDHITVTAVIPHAMCPGHFDLSPRTAQSIVEADLFLQHGFETFTRGLTTANDGATRLIMKTKGNGMIPSVHCALTTEVLTALCNVSPANTADFQANAAAYAQAITQAETAVQSARSKLAGTPVFAAVMNAPFVAWTGCTVIDTFPRDENLSAKKLIALLQTGERQGVQLIVDNQQSLGKTGRKLATSLKVPLIVLSNFPSLAEGGYPIALQTSLKRLMQNLNSPNTSGHPPAVKEAE